MFVVTLLSAVLCGAPAGLPTGECATAESSIWEATSYTEAEDDWQDCLKRRKAMKAGSKYQSVECDQFDPNAKVIL